MKGKDAVTTGPLSVRSRHRPERADGPAHGAPYRDREPAVGASAASPDVQTVFLWGWRPDGFSQPCLCGIILPFQVVLFNNSRHCGIILLT